MTISKERKDWIWAISALIFFILLFACSILPFYYGIGFGIVMGLSFLIKLNKPVSEKRKKIIGVIMLFVTPILMFYLTELLNVNSMHVLLFTERVLLNLVIYYLVELLLLFICKKSNIAILITTVLFMIIAIINGFVVELRGYGFMLSDIYSITTATNMLGEYTYLLNIEHLIAIVCSAFIVRLSMSFIVCVKKRLIGSIVSATLLVAYIVLMACTPMLTLFSVEPNFYHVHENGFYVNFLGTVWVYNSDKSPDGYSSEAIYEKFQVIQKEYEDYTASNMVKPKNVICIMNEALADFTVYENFNLEDPLQYIHSLKENTISGYVYSSVFGGRTVISEYEFLTNNTSYFLTGLTSPHSTVVNSQSYSLAKQFKEYGYDTTFLHPYTNVSYNRPNAYKNLGFDEQYYETDLMRDFSPQYLYSDAELYKAIEQITESKDNSFIFAITMQNHSPFNFLDDKDLDMVSSGYGELVDRYLTLAKESDNAFEELVNYYSNSDEPTIIVMFGDHQPKLDNAYFESLSGIAFNTLFADSKQTIYQTPFVIWANYDIAEQENVNISINYLSLLMLEQTGIPKTRYQYFLSNLMNELPVINGNGMIDKNGNSYSKVSEMSEKLQKLVTNYHFFEYNLVFDSDDRIEKLNSSK